MGLERSFSILNGKRKIWSRILLSCMKGKSKSLMNVTDHLREPRRQFYRSVGIIFSLNNLIETHCKQAVLRRFQDFNNHISNSLGQLNKKLRDYEGGIPKYVMNSSLKPITINVEKAVKLIMNFKLERNPSKPSRIESIPEIPKKNTSSRLLENFEDELMNLPSVSMKNIK